MPGAQSRPPRDRSGVDRRVFLRTSVGVSAGLVAGPAVVAWPAPTASASVNASAASTVSTAFVDSYTTNVIGNLTSETNAAVHILDGFARIWKTGTAWNTGTPLMPETLRANMRYCARVTRRRTEAEARTAFIQDRQHQSYAVIAGLGPLADLYRSGAKAVTGITSAPDGIPAGKINDTLPADAPAGSALGAGSYTSDLGKVAELVDTVRGPFASSNPSKLAYQYPRPWRMNEDSEVVDTGRTDELGFPVYESDVVVVPQLLRQRGSDPADDGGFSSGHTNAFYLAALAMAYAVPERFQELVARASELAHTRIVAGMHNTVDVVGGRVLATALAAAALADPKNADLKSAARAQASAYFQERTGTTADTLYAYAHSAGRDTDPYADRSANWAAVRPRLTYVLPKGHAHDHRMTVPKGAEVLLETRLPYLTAAQRREVLRTTALPAGYVLLDGFEQWGRLNLFAAVDGYGAFDTDVRVALDAAAGGFGAADIWRNDIGGRGALVKLGTGALTLTGDNAYSGGSTVEEGVLATGSADALGCGDVWVNGGALRVASPLRVGGSYVQASGTTLDVTLGGGRVPALKVSRRVLLDRGAELVVRLDDSLRPRRGAVLPVIENRALRGRFGSVTVDGFHAEPVFTARGLSVRLA
ncbi:phosphatase PAP2 family protein [Streptomyces sp. NBC_00878]|uniref:phosphatase PAP2 family protein n=1 Tax=Streptomyces sp. NBC_00878 TaxID=2975854 RepID=UPI002256E7D1|nr:phosphatase PAP2 family protein [Streptomyces sp. NBC_00878]MCX4903892.1 phosphatase PAP2 family protein [Streptomyces sp. NBC_00878]